MRCSGLFHYNTQLLPTTAPQFLLQVSWVCEILHTVVIIFFYLLKASNSINEGPKMCVINKLLRSWTLVHDWVILLHGKAEHFRFWMPFGFACWVCFISIYTVDKCAGKVIMCPPTVVFVVSIRGFKLFWDIFRWQSGWYWENVYTSINELPSRAKSTDGRQKKTGL